MRRTIAIALLLLSPMVFADANDGEYLGFKLGDTFYAPRGSVARNHFIGAVTYTVDPETRHLHTGSLSVYVSPKSSIIGGIFGEWYFFSEGSAKNFAEGYLRNLETKYSDWRRRRSSLSNGDYQFWVDLEQKPPIIDYWPSDKKFRVSAALTYAPDSLAQRDWRAKIDTEVDEQRLRAGK